MILLVDSWSAESVAIGGSAVLFWLVVVLVVLAIVALVMWMTRR